jgi:hypothetical protein
MVSLPTTPHKPCMASVPRAPRDGMICAQMEKRSSRKAGADERAYMNCRRVLERGLTHNPGSVKIIVVCCWPVTAPSSPLAPCLHSAAPCVHLLQALGLLALQYNRYEDAVDHLEAAATMDPACAAVLRWKLVQAAKQSCCDCDFR